MYGKHHAADNPEAWAAAFARFGWALQNKFAQGSTGNYSRRPKYNVPLNIADKGDHYEVYVYALGFSKEHITLSVAEDVLYIIGKKTIDEAQAPTFVRQEYPIKTFERTVNLYGKVDAGNIRARQEEGVLVITLPKMAGEKIPAQEIVID